MQTVLHSPGDFASRDPPTYSERSTPPAAATTMRLCQVVRRAEPFCKAGVREGRVHGQAESSEGRFVAVSELAAAQTGAMYTHSIRATTVAELNAGGECRCEERPP